MLPPGLAFGRRDRIDAGIRRYISGMIFPDFSVLNVSHAGKPHRAGDPGDLPARHLPQH